MEAKKSNWTLAVTLFFLGGLIGSTAAAVAQDRQLERMPQQQMEVPPIIRMADSTHRITCYYNTSTRLHSCAPWGN